MSEGWSIRITRRQLDQVKAGQTVRVEVTQGTVAIREDDHVIVIRFSPSDLHQPSPAWRPSQRPG